MFRRPAIREQDLAERVGVLSKDRPWCAERPTEPVAGRPVARAPGWCAIAGLGMAFMTGEATLKEVIGRLGKALGSLEDAVEARLEREQGFADAEAELQRMNADRSRLAQEIDGSEARAKRLEEVNREVSRRLVTAMETIRAVLDR